MSTAPERPYRPYAVSDHARERFKARFPKLSRGDDASFMAREVKSAMENGRYSTRKPGWTSVTNWRGGKNNGAGTMRWCWPDGKNRAYLCRKFRSPAGTTWLVVTVYPRDPRVPKEI